jgi:diguanylate cyclase (GGDEF)-like protein/PAS domain S-box-containing protein
VKRLLVIVVLVHLIVGLSTTVRAEDTEDGLYIDINQHHSIMLIIDPDSGEIINANEAAATFYGYSVDSIVGMNISDFNIMSEEAIAEEMLAVKNGEKEYFKFTHQIRSGELKAVEVYSSPIFIGEEEYLLSIIHDVTNQVMAERQATFNLWIILLLTFALFFSMGIYTLNQKKNSKEAMELNTRYDSLFGNMEEGVARHRIILNEAGEPCDYRFLSANEAFYKHTNMVGYDIIGKTVKELFPETEEYWIQQYGQVAIHGERLHLEEYSSALDKYFAVNVYSPLKMEFVTVFSDITEMQKTANIIQKDRAILKTTLYSLGDGVISTNKEGQIELMNPVAEKITGWSLDEAKGKDFCDVFKIVNEFTELNVECPVKQVLTTKDLIDFEEHSMLINKLGEKIPIENIAAPIFDGDDSLMGSVVVFRDVADKRKRIEKITYLSYHDQLTGLYNRYFFDEELKRLDVQRNMPLSLLMIDVNGLKLTNDAFGHIAGDELLKRVASSLKKMCRQDDIIARVGGDEFIVLLPKTTEDEAKHLSSRIQEAISEIESSKVVTSVSIGWATKWESYDSVHQLYTTAEERMYRRKLTESQIMRKATIELILKTLHETVTREKEHSERVSQFAVMIGKALKLEQEEINDLEILGLLHDIGKITVEPEILNKKGVLTKGEYQNIQKHVEIGYQLLKSVDQYLDLAEYVLCHHERYDGQGYPRKLKGEEIPLFSRIIAVADSFEAMTSNRVYKKTMTIEASIIELKELAGEQYDPMIVEAFCKKLNQQ